MTYPTRTIVPEGAGLKPACIGMGSMDRLGGLCQPETTKAPALATPRPAAIRTGRVVVKVGAAHLEALVGSEDGCILPEFQGGKQSDRIHSRQESGMDERGKQALEREAYLVFAEAERLMRRWTSGPSPFLNRFTKGQMDRLWDALGRRADQVLDALWYEFGYTDEQLDRERHFFILMMRMMLEGARADDAPAPVVEEPPRVVILPDQSESPIERAMFGALRQFARLCRDPGQIREYCEHVPAQKGIFLFQQAPVLRYRADFLLGAMSSPEGEPHWVVVECDGHEFHERTAEQAEHDRARDRAMTAAGYRVFRFTGREIRRDRQRCADEVLAYLRPFAGGRV